MIHLLLVLALVLLVFWLFFHAAGDLFNLIWVLILIALVLWVFGFFYPGGTRKL